MSRLAYCVSFRLSVRARPDSESWVRTRIRKDISTKYVVPYSSHCTIGPNLVVAARLHILCITRFGIVW